MVFFLLSIRSIDIALHYFDSLNERATNHGNWMNSALLRAKILGCQMRRCVVIEVRVVERP